MEQQINVSTDAKFIAPVWARVVAWILLIEGILRLLLFIILLSKGNFILGFLQFVIGIIAIIAFFGIRGMKKWAFYVFILVFILNLFYSFFNSSLRMYSDIGYIVVRILMLVYLLSIYKKFI